MLIVEEDLKIERNENYYTLYFLKSKKELTSEAKKAKELEFANNSEEDKELISDLKSLFRIAGYYRCIRYAFLTAYKWRKDKKYPFKEDSKELAKVYNKYIKSINMLDNLSNDLFRPIEILKKDTFEKHKREGF